ncbi:MAG: glutamate/cysteine ligase family protein [Streptosporangiaceae bacterium]|nr:glutamate/cysteine ligase family protein [Streptosporangiaceae bacterium]
MTRLTVDDVYQHSYGVCFKTGPPGVVGAETEWLVVDPRRPGAHVSLDRLRDLMDAAGPPPAGSLITYEPGGQLELSSAPQPGLAALYDALSLDLAFARKALGDLALAGHGVDPVRAPFMQTRDQRYLCMSTYFETHSKEGGLPMMCGTASVQVCVDIGADSADAVRRWRLAHALGPILVAAFANSPLRAGRRTGLKSTRQAIWNALDPGRTTAPAGADPAEAWARYALDANVMMRRTPDGGWVADPGTTFREWVATGEPTAEDLDYHLSTLFPPVRPRGWYELRMIDALPEPYWPVPVAVVTALLDDPVASRLAEEAAEPVAGRWRQAAGDALADRELARAARACFEAARAALPRLDAERLLPLVDDYYSRYIERGRCPADDLTLTLATAPVEEDLSWNH